jgi:thioredoxin reductase
MDLLKKQFLVIGAGPFSIATAAYAKFLGIDTAIVGRTLHFWKAHMPKGMFLRSDFDWHLDARDVHTFEAFMNSSGKIPEQSKPISLQLFCEYVLWFMKQYDLQVLEQHVTDLKLVKNQFIAKLEDGSEIQACRVLLGLGYAGFPNLPTDVVSKLPEGSFSHTCDTVEFERFRSKRILIIGGRQSAFEWAALIRESGAEEVHLMFRHPAPRFAESDWSWVQPMARIAVQDHGWWRKLTEQEKETIRQKFFANGRLILEPWLDPRVHQPNIQIHENTNIAGVRNLSDSYEVELLNGKRINVHHILLATGYRTNMSNIRFLDSSILKSLEIADGYPVLDPEFQTSVPGLYITGVAATQDFGPFFGFTAACPVAAKIIAEAIEFNATAQSR